MNIRKNIDYSEMYKDLDDLMAKELTQMELYCEIGKAVCQRTEKGAAVMASEYLNKNYPDVKGFSPRSLRRMRDFYRTYENYPSLLSRAMQLGWIQNVVIMEAGLTMELREWYIKAAKQFGWTKTELIANIAANAHVNVLLSIENEVSYIMGQEEKQTETPKHSSVRIKNTICQFVRKIRKWMLIWKCGKRRWRTMLFQLERRLKYARDFGNKGEHLICCISTYRVTLFR